MKSNKAALSNSLSAADLLAERLTSNSRASSASSLAFDTDATDAQSQQQLVSSKVIQHTGSLHSVHPAGTRCSANLLHTSADLQYLSLHSMPPTEQTLENLSRAHSVNTCADWQLHRVHMGRPCAAHVHDLRHPSKQQCSRSPLTDLWQVPE